MNSTTDTNPCPDSSMIMAVLVNTALTIAAPLLYGIRKYMRAQCKAQLNVSIDHDLDVVPPPPT